MAAKQWLVSVQGSEGGWDNYGYNANSTGLAAQALAGNTAATDKAQQFLGSLQITCDWVLANPKALAVADVGAIATDQDTFDNVTDNGIIPSLSWTVASATSQGTLGLGGPNYATVSAKGIDAKVPDVTCSAPVTPPGGEETPSTPAPPAPAAPAAPAAPKEVGTGGTASHTAGWVWLAPAMMVLGAGLLRRAVAR